MTETFWPSKYGPDDEAGALNEITATAVVRAASLVKRGRVFDLAHILDDAIPAFPGRGFRQMLTTDPNRRVGRNQVVVVAGEFDPLTHRGGRRT
jgi:hypothetical protein